MLTGAGVSAESGVPTFRGETGLWRDYRPEELATPQAFDREPRLVWEWYGWRRDLVSKCEPNDAHVAIAERVLESGETRVITQNVDGLHTQAAEAVAESSDLSPLQRPIELHGSLFRTRCTACGKREASHAPIDASSEETLPRCAACSALLRPDVVWFGESLDPGLLTESFKLAGEIDVCLVVGTSAVVHPAASIAFAAADAGAVVIEINPEATPLSSVARVSLRGTATEVVRGIL